MTQVLPRLEPIAGGGGDVGLSVQGVSKKFGRSLKRSPIAVAAHLEPEILSEITV